MPGSDLLIWSNLLQKCKNAKMQNRHVYVYVVFNIISRMSEIFCKLLHYNYITCTQNLQSVSSREGRSNDAKKVAASDFYEQPTKFQWGPARNSGNSKLCDAVMTLLKENKRLSPPLKFLHELLYSCSTNMRREQGAGLEFKVWRPGDKVWRLGDVK